MSKLPLTIRAAASEDMVSVAEIHSYYVLNTVITFILEPLTVEQHIDKLKHVQEQNLPYIVALSEDANVVGFSYLSGFRSGKGAYRHTVELSLFCHPNYLYRGVGTALLNKILDAAADPASHPECIASVRAEDQKVRQIIACMAVNTDSKDEGLGLRKYYEGFGFVLNGHLKQVGYKFGRWCASNLNKQFLLMLQQG